MSNLSAVCVIDYCFAVVDAADFDWISQWRWFTQKGYATRRSNENGTRKKVYMHRLIAGAKPGEFVDHIDGDRLNNTRANLRICTRSENNRNVRAKGGSSVYKGVSFYSRHSKWSAIIDVDKSTRFLGYFADETEAALAYDRAARAHFGEYAWLNFPDDLQSGSVCPCKVCQDKVKPILCSICGAKQKGLGLCSRHYLQHYAQRRREAKGT